MCCVGLGSPDKTIRHSGAFMLQSTMQKPPETFTQKFQSVFTTQVLLAIIGILMGVIVARIIGI